MSARYQHINIQYIVNIVIAKMNEKNAGRRADEGAEAGEEISG